jgi:hypothetical protein
LAKSLPGGGGYGWLVQVGACFGCDYQYYSRRKKRLLEEVKILLETHPRIEVSCGHWECTFKLTRLETTPPFTCTSLCHSDPYFLFIGSFLPPSPCPILPAHLLIIFVVQIFYIHRAFNLPRAKKIFVKFRGDRYRHQCLHVVIFLSATITCQFVRSSVK